MLKYKIDVIAELKMRGYNTNRIRRERLLNESALQYFRENKPIGAKALNTLCCLLDCQPGDILEYVPDQSEKKG